ncbi:hypothetical protein GOBAR_AA33117 [Gossypium barbadense]|uniref:Uncharacterized protein n=1 Tax=Gossypium barbadense TaxID=3634 RepID=A0A2P5W900_GOSBA|nr:hypothetical protein GOBAR_AA33117 [Gossypium barbadense]
MVTRARIAWLKSPKWPVGWPCREELAVWVQYAGVPIFYTISLVFENLLCAAHEVEEFPDKSQFLGTTETKAIPHSSSKSRGCATSNLPPTGMVYHKC